MSDHTKLLSTWPTKTVYRVSLIFSARANCTLCLDTDSVFVNAIRDNVTGCVTFMIGEWGKRGGIERQFLHYTTTLRRLFESSRMWI